MLFAPALLDGLPLVRYAFYLTAQTNAQLPLYLGSTLRGAFGHALKSLACTVAHQNCAVCLLRANCRYPVLFEPQPNPQATLATGHDAPRPFIFVPPPLPQDSGTWRHQHRTLTAGQTLTFGLTLCGATALAAAPYFVAAIQLVAHQGLGLDRHRFTLERVMTLPLAAPAQTIYTPAHNHLTPPPDAPFTLGDWTRSRLAQVTQQEGLTLTFLTPTRLRQRGQVVGQPDFALLVKLLSLRLALLAATHGATPLEYDYQALVRAAQQVPVDTSGLFWRELERRTNRRNTTMDLDGIMGRLEVQGEQWREFVPLLAAGEAVHVGSNTAFGLGRYQLNAGAATYH